MSVGARIEKLERHFKASQDGWLEMPDGERVAVPGGGVSLLRLTLYEMNKWSARIDGREPPTPRTANYEPTLDRARLAVAVHEPDDAPGIAGALAHFMRLNDQLPKETEQ